MCTHKYYIHVYTCVCVNIDIYASVFVDINMRVWELCVRTHVFVCEWVYACVCACMCGNMCVCVCLCVYTYFRKARIASAFGENMLSSKSSSTSSSSSSSAASHSSSKPSSCAGENSASSPSSSSGVKS